MGEPRIACPTCYREVTEGELAQCLDKACPIKAALPCQLHPHCICERNGIPRERRANCAWNIPAQAAPPPPPPSSVDAWDERWLALAFHIAAWSKDPSSKVGAVAVRDRRLLATGFNGFPAGMQDDERLDHREQKYPRIVHAEQNVIAWAAREGAALKGASLYVAPFHPCADCAKLIVQAGFAEVVYQAGPVPERWAEGFRLAADILAECGVMVRGVAL